MSGASVAEIKTSVDYDPRKISWSDHLFSRVKRGLKASNESGIGFPSIYRPFERSWVFYSEHFNDRRGQMPRIFPHPNTENLVIQVSGVGARSGFSVLMTNCLPNLHTVDSGQCFPLYITREL